MSSKTDEFVTDHSPCSKSKFEIAPQSNLNAKG